MRYILIFTTLLAFNCAHFQGTSREINIFGYNFTKYTNAGFLITPLSYSNTYQSIGLITVQFYPAVTKRDSIATNKSTYSFYSAEEIKPNIVLDTLYNIAVKMGANAIINFKSLPIEKTVSHFRIEGIQVEGFAIKR